MAGKMDERVPVRSNDEIGLLAEAFNGMMEKIEVAQAELVQSNTELEVEIAVVAPQTV